MTDWLITGAGGTLGSVLLRQLTAGGHDAVGVVSPSGPRPALGRTLPLDLLEAEAVADAVDALAPLRIVHAAALADTARASREPDLARRINIEATRTLAGVAARTGRRLALISTDMVFDGEHAPYDETSSPAPGTVYGRSKLAAEQAVLTEPRLAGVVVRLPLLYGVPAAPRATSFLSQVHALRNGTPLRLFEDEVRSPLWLEDAASAIIAIAQSELVGAVHAAGPERLTRVEMGRLLARALGVSDASILVARQRDADDLEPRPRDLSLNSARYSARFGRAPGRPMAEALAAVFAH